VKLKPILLAAVSITLLTASLSLYNTYAKTQEERAALSRRKEKWERLKDILGRKVRRFKGTVGLIIEDLQTKERISFNEDTLIPSASLVKVPIMLSCFYAAQEGKISLKDQIRLKRSDKVAGSKVLGDEPSGSVFTVEELLHPMITRSDNAAANMLIEFMGFERLEAYFKKMGLKDTNLNRKMMDFKERAEGEENYTTARDMSYLLKKLYEKKFLNKDVSEKCLEILGDQKINDRIPKKLPPGTCVMHKTGLERYVCHDAGIVYTDKGDFLVCVLARHRGRYARPSKKFISDVTLLTYKYFQSL